MTLLFLKVGLGTRNLDKVKFNLILTEDIQKGYWGYNQGKTDYRQMIHEMISAKQNLKQMSGDVRVRRRYHPIEGGVKCLIEY